MNQDICQGRHRLEVWGREHESAVVDRVTTHRFPPAVVNMSPPIGGQGPQPVGSHGAGTRQQLPVPERGDQVRRRRRKRVQPPAGLQESRTHSAPEGSIIHSQLCQRRPPRSPAANFQGPKNFH